jgi:hypothetical protein
MANTADHIRSRFAAISDRIDRLGRELQALKDAMPEQRQETDFGRLELQPPFFTVWNEPPDLPALRKFESHENAIEYIYRLMPKLQGYLNAIHLKLTDVDNQLPAFARREDTDGAEANVADLSQSVEMLAKHLQDMRGMMGKMANKDEIVAALRKVHAPPAQGPDMRTAIGCVKCMACGRDMAQVSGAMPEEEATKMLGAPPNCVATGSPSALPFAPMYTANTMEAFDTARIIESPRAGRSFRAISAARRKIQHPVAPPK